MEKLPRLRSEQQLVIAGAISKLTSWGLCDDSKEVAFLQKMIDRIDRGKCLTQGQKRWVLDIVNRSAPDDRATKRIDDLLSCEGISDMHSLLSSYRQQVLGGKPLTEKQELWVQRAEEERVKASRGERFMLTPEMNERLNLCRSIFNAKRYYFAHKRSYGMIDDILTLWETTKRLTKKQYEVVTRPFESMLKPIDNPDYPVGEMAKIPAGVYYHDVEHSDRHLLEEDAIGLAIEVPFYHEFGDKFYQKFLANGKPIYVNVRVLKRPWRRGKNA